MSKNVERTKNHEVLGIEGTKKELNELKKDIKLQNNFRLSEGNPENEKSLKDKLNNIIQLSEIGEFNDNGDFVVKESIKGEDDIGSFISIRGKKYYDYITRSSYNDNFTGLGYEIGKFTDNTGYITLGYMNGNIFEQKTEYFQDGKIYNGKCDLYGCFIEGIAKIPVFDCIKIYQGTFDGFVPKDGTLEKYKDGSLKYTYKGNFSWFNPDGRGRMWWPNEDSYSQMYEGERKNGKFEGKGKLTCKNWTYDGEWINGKKEGFGMYTLKTGFTYIGEWSNDKPKEGEGTMLWSNGDEYKGYILINDEGQPEKFYENENFKKMREKQLSSGDPTTQNMKGIYTSENGSYHEYIYTNGSITEKSNDFITIYRDKKPDENWSSERGNIEYTINYHSASNIEFRLRSRKGREINRKFNGNNYIYKDIKGNELKIPSSNFGEKKALHAANLINCIRYTNETKHNNRAYRFNNNNLYATTMREHPREGIVYADNGTTLLEDVAKHFGGINAETLATWLNNAKR